MHVKQPVNPWTKKNNGICYIDTVTKQAAQQAIGVFKNAKLEGRTLVVELSNDDHSTTGESDVPGNSLSGASVGTLLIKEETVALREGRLAWIGGVVKGFINAKLFGKSEEIQTPSKIPRESRQRVWICGLPLISESSLQEELGRFISPVSRNFKIVGGIEGWKKAEWVQRMFDFERNLVLHSRVNH
ncbi:hypothetical protein B0J14DRAFT_640442 [Halenospora varia]|nr:hypothetical protein B0J14DRAFT_640442 [Halenospora varia]